MDGRESILIVDDDENTCVSLSLVFGQKGYETETVGTGQKAIEKAQGKSFNVALLDIKLPDTEGTELIAPLRELQPDMALIMITAYASLESAVRALNEGAWGYILKPFSMDEMLATVVGALVKQRLLVESRRLFDEAQRELAAGKWSDEEARHGLVRLQRTFEAAITALASVVEMKDPFTAGHQRRVTKLARAIAEEMGLPKEQIEGIGMAALAHDIGKLYVPAEILNKPGRLSETEFALIKVHPKLGYDVLRMIEFPWPVAQIVLQHHERLDGSGYPWGLTSDEIMLEAKVLAVADVVEAMASDRPHRPSLGITKALAEISQNKGVLYDPEVVDACLNLFTEKGFEFE